MPSKDEYKDHGDKYMSKNTKDSQKPPEARRKHVIACPSQHSVGTIPADTLISVFWHPKPWDYETIDFGYWRHLLRHFVEFCYGSTSKRLHWQAPGCHQNTPGLFQSFFLSGSSVSSYTALHPFSTLQSFEFFVIPYSVLFMIIYNFTIIWF